VTGDAGADCPFNKGRATLDPELFPDETQEQSGTCVEMETMEMLGDDTAEMVIFGKQEGMLLVLTSLRMLDSSSNSQKAFWIKKWGKVLQFLGFDGIVGGQLAEVIRVRFFLDDSHNRTEGSVQFCSGEWAADFGFEAETESDHSLHSGER
jgi:hypothetical protein